MRSNAWIIYDTEIRNGVVTENNPRRDGFHYADGWDDFSGMGISVLCAYDTRDRRYRVFCADNLQEFSELVARRRGIIDPRDPTRRIRVEV